MTDNAEIAGNIRIEILWSQTQVNEWLESHGDVEVVSIQFSTAEYDGGVQESVMIVYRKES
jgi:hypothetical protein